MLTNLGISVRSGDAVRTDRRNRELDTVSVGRAASVTVDQDGGANEVGSFRDNSR